MVQNSNLVRPLPASSSSSSIKLTSLDGRKKKTPLIVVVLWSACLFLLVMCVLLGTALVLVGRHYAKQSSLSTSAVLLSNWNSIQNPSLSQFNSSDKSVLVLNKAAESQDSEVQKPVSSLDGKMSVKRFVNELSFRLQKEIKPKLYKLELHPHLDTKLFSGRVTIDLEVVKPVSFIAIHSKKLNITKTNLFSAKQQSSVKISQTYNYEEHEYWVTELEEPIESGDYQFSLDFNGDLANRIVGFYSSTYFSANKNQTRTIATSKFEPTYARQAFPCFDEPAKKAEFEISLVRPSGDDYIALSNTNELSSEPFENNTDLTLTKFAKSVPMSTYLACFIVCDFLKKSAVVEARGIGKNFELRVFATPEQLNKVDLAVDTAKRITEHYIQYFGIEYPLAKLDMIAIPDFVSGAMEHWGLVTYRETALLYDAGISSSRNKQRVATVIAHELAHQWFGNLVTMEFWNDLWLNEGFASYIEYKGCDAIFPNWDMKDQFLVDDFFSVLGLDASLATHPIVQNVSHPDQITEIFDKITYSKGASIIRMLEDIIGSENFRKSVSNYLNRHKYGNAVTNDLLTEIEKLNFDFDIKFIMDTWTRQGGFPVVGVSQVADGKYRLTQKRFFSNPENENKELPPSDFNYRWYIPITYFTEVESTVKRTWFSNTDNEIEMTVDNQHEWIKLNKDQMGYYLVNYSPELWNKLTVALSENSSLFSVSDRANLLNDAFLLAEATQLDYAIALNLTTYLNVEKDFVPWKVAVSKLHKIKGLVSHTDVVKKVKTYSLNLIDSLYQEIGWTVDEGNHSRNLLRMTLMDFACEVGHESALAYVGVEFEKWLTDPNVRPHPDIREVVYDYGMQVKGNESTWAKMWEIFRKETDASESIKLMSGLSNVKDPSILRRYINLAWDENNVRRQDYFTCLALIAGNPIGESLVWEYVREHWPDMVDRFGLNERYLGSMIPDISKNFATEIKLKEMKDFFEKYPEAGAGARSRKLALENINNNIKWLQTNLNPVTDWFNQNA